MNLAIMMKNTTNLAPYTVAGYQADRSLESIYTGLKSAVEDGISHGRQTGRYTLSSGEFGYENYMRDLLNIYTNTDKTAATTAIIPNADGQTVMNYISRRAKEDGIAIAFCACAANGEEYFLNIPTQGRISAKDGLSIRVRYRV